MSMATSTAIGLGLGIAGIGSSVATGIVGSNAAKDSTNAQVNAANHAADLQSQAATNSLNFQKQQYGNSLSLLSPFYNTGVSANSRLAYLMGLNPAQGLPPGVVNPNAPATSTQPTLNGSMVDPDTLNSLRALRGGGTTASGQIMRPMQAQSAMVPMTPNSDVAPPAASGQPGSMLQSGQPGGFLPNPDIGNFNAGAAGSGGVTNVSGAPGTVAQTGGGLPNPSPDAGNVGGPNGGGFGSLETGWNQTFQSPTDVTEQNDPGYQFRLAQGQQALQNSAAARGGLLSGGTAKALTDYNQNAASGEYGNVYNRALQNYNTNYNTFTNDQTNTFNRLAALSGQGQVTANNLSNSGLSFANNSGSILTGAANNIGQDYQNIGAAQASGYNNPFQPYTHCS
jgi:hypothetical protein